MILHNIKIAIRNLLKYKTQSAISITSLAVGFACMALAIFWNQYEMTYDAFQKNADRIYRVRHTSATAINKQVSNITPGPLSKYLQENYPEVESACAMRGGYNSDWTAEDRTHQLKMLSVTPEAMDIFDFVWLDGNKDITQWGQKLAITDEAAQRLFGAQSPIGKKLRPTRGNLEYEITAVIKAWPKHSNIAFDLIAPLNVEKQWNMSAYDTYMLLKENTDHTSLIQKIQKDTIKNEHVTHVFDVITPLKELHYTYPVQQLNVTLEHVRMFTASAILIVLCALLNYLTLFISRIRSKGRYMALRTVCGSSSIQLNILLMTEYMLLLLTALVVSLLLIEISMKSFIELANVSVDRIQLYRTCSSFIIYIIIFAAVLSFIPIYYFKQHTLYALISPIGVHANRSHFRSISLCIQLIISFLFLLCSIIMIKQLYYLSHSDININRKQIAWVYSNLSQERSESILKQLPMVKEIVATRDPLFPPGMGNTFFRATEWEERKEDAEPVLYQVFHLNDNVANIYGLRMKEGAQSFNIGENEIIINETLAKSLNMEHPVGKMLEQLRIKGVMYDFRCQPPTHPVTPMGFIKDDNRADVLTFSYEGEWDACKKSITTAFKDDPSLIYLTMEDAEETYNEYIVSERNLLKLLGSITLISILISLFGVYAQMVQTCEQRRKEIAIRKVNGAHMNNILLLFIKEYLLLAIISAVIAFPIGYAIMKRWLENYERQIEIHYGIFLEIFIAMVLLIITSIGWRVWKTASENPAEVIKHES